MDSNLNPPSRHGGKRKNAGRPKVATPLKKAKRLLNRRILREKLKSITCELVDMLGAHLQNTEEYTKKAQLYLKVSKFLGRPTSEFLYSGILSQEDRDEASSLRHLDELYTLVHGDSDEVCFFVSLNESYMM